MSRWRTFIPAWAHKEIGPNRSVIYCKRIEDIDGNNTTVYQWFGESPFIWINGGIIEETKGCVSLGQIDIEILHYAPEYDSFFAVRHINGYQLLVLRFRLHQALMFVYYSVLRRLHKAGLMNTPDGVQYSWRDIKILHRISGSHGP